MSKHNLQALLSAIYLLFLNTSCEASLKSRGKSAEKNETEVLAPTDIPKIDEPAVEDPTQVEIPPTLSLQQNNFNFPDAIVGKTNKISLTLKPSKPFEATFSGVTGDISYEGNSFPGTTGTCTQPISSECSVVLELTPTSAKIKNYEITISNGKNVLQKANISTKSYLLVGQNEWVAPTDNELEVDASAAIVIGGKFVVADTVRNRVLIWNSFPTAGTRADIVIGQPDLWSVGGNNGGISARSLVTPQGLATDGTKLLISDTGNHRILIFNQLPTANHAAADLVLGQPDFTSDNFSPGVTTQDTFEIRHGITTDGTRIFAADFTNRRVLGWTTFPTTNGTLPNIVLGQPNFTSRASNQGGRSAASLNNPHAVLIYADRLFVGDSGNARVLIWEGIPTTIREPADRVLGQSGFTTVSSIAGFSTVSYPISLAYNGTHLAVGQSTWSRISIFSFTPTDPITNGAAATFILGQPDETSIVANPDGVNNKSINVPQFLQFNGNKLLVSDTGNRRFIEYTSVTQTYQSASNIRFTADSDEIYSRSLNPSAGKIFRPHHVAKNDSSVILSDYGNDRLLIWSDRKDFGFKNPDKILGQTDFNSSVKNYGGVNGVSLDAPVSVYAKNSMFFVSDYQNNRITYWNTLPENSATPLFALGQSNFTSNDFAVTANGFRGPTSVDICNEALIASDQTNHRILIWKPIPTSGTDPATVVIGQTDFTSGTRNEDLPVAATGLNRPSKAFCIGNKLLVVDTNNNRVLIWNTIPTTNHVAADVVVNQADLTSSSTTVGNSVMVENLVSATYDLKRSRLLLHSPTQIFAVDGIPTQNGVTGELIYGNSEHYGHGPGQVRQIKTVEVWDDVLMIVDSGNNRVLGIPLAQ